MVDERQINMQHGTWVEISSRTLPRIKTYWLWLIATIACSIYVAILNSQENQLFESYLLNGQISRSEPYRLITYMFLHANLVHLGLNMLAYLQLARFTEMLYGSWRFNLIYLSSGVLAGSASVLWNNNVHTVGASGAILGLMGALLAYTLVLDKHMPTDLKVQMKKDIWVTVALTTLLGIFIPNVDNAAHIGGFIAGFILGILLTPREYEKTLFARLVLAALTISMGLSSIYMVNYKYAENQYKYEKQTKAIFKQIWEMEKNIVYNYKNLISTADELEYNTWYSAYQDNVIHPLKDMEDKLKYVATPIDTKSKTEYELLKQYIALKRKEADSVAIWIKTRDLKLLEQLDEYNSQNDKLKASLAELNKNK